MKTNCLPAVAVVLAVSASLYPRGGQAAVSSARVTRIVRDVKLLPSKEKPRPAILHEKLNGGTGLRTGDASLSELTFSDLTIQRLGSNTVFSFNRGGRDVRLDSGSVLLRVPKNSGGASMSTAAVTVGITGTTVILETTRIGRNKLTVLEGGARVSLNKNRSQSVYVRGGQMEDVPPGATRLPPPVNVDLNEIMSRNPLITDFAPLPSRDLILATASNPIVYEGKPVDQEPAPTGPGFLRPPLIGVGRGLAGGHRHFPTGTDTNTRNPGKGQDGGRTPGHGTTTNNASSKNAAGLNHGKSSSGSGGQGARPSPAPKHRSKSGTPQSF